MAIQVTGNEINATGAMSLVTSSGTESTIDTLGNVVTQTRPSFKYHAQTTGGSEWSAYNSPLVNTHQVGTGFNTSTGQFTAPIAGVYHFNMICMTQSNAGDSRFALYKNGAQFGPKTIIVSTQGNHHNNCSFATTCYLAQGDYVRPIMYSGSAAYNGDWNCFSGYYVGEYL